MTREEEARAVLNRHLLHSAITGGSSVTQNWATDATVAAMIDFSDKIADAEAAAMRERAFQIGDRVEKISGSSWRGKVVGTYSTALTPEGYAVESDTEVGSVQIYPAKALRLVRALPATGEVGR